ncbi:MAG: hypothetical protein V8R40_12715 [Dysosmobacter sp.]
MVESPMRPDGVRKLADAVAQDCGGLAAVFAGEETANTAMPWYARTGRTLPPW